MTNVELRPSVHVTPAMTEALQRLDTVQAEVRANAPEVAVQPTTVWEAPSPDELVAWKQTNGVRYMGESRDPREVPQDTRRKKGVWNHHSTGAQQGKDIISVTDNQRLGEKSQVVSTVPNVPTQRVGTSTARVGGRVW